MCYFKRVRATMFASEQSRLIADGKHENRCEFLPLSVIFRLLDLASHKHTAQEMSGFD